MRMLPRTLAWLLLSLGASASAASLTPADQLRVQAFRTCVADELDQSSEPFGRSPAAARLHSPDLRQASKYRSVAPGLFLYQGVNGANEFCGIIFTGRPSAALLDALGDLASANDMGPSPLTMWSLGDATEQKWRYWGARLYNGGRGILAASHRLDDGTVVTEINYHSILIT